MSLRDFIMPFPIFTVLLGLAGRTALKNAFMKIKNQGVSGSSMQMEVKEALRRKGITM